MTQVTVRMTSRDVHVRMLGHAGDDLVCAGISTVVGAMLNVLGDDAEKVVYEPGHVEFSSHRPRRESMGAIRVLIEAMMMLSEKFPGRVGVTLEKPHEIQ